MSPDHVSLSNLPKTVVLREHGWRVVVLAVEGDHAGFSCTCTVIPTADAWDTSGPFPRPTDDMRLDVSAFEPTGRELDRGDPSERSSTHYPVIIASYFFESAGPHDENNPITLQFRSWRRDTATSGPPRTPAGLLEQTSEVVALIDDGLELAARHADAIEIVYNSADREAAVARLVNDLSVSEVAAGMFVSARISSLTERSRKDREKSRQWALRDIERLAARLAKSKET